MSIKTFVSEFQDYLFNLLPVYDRLNIDKTSKTDFYGAAKNAEEILEKYGDSLEFLEKNALSVPDEINTILNSLDNKIEKINTFATTIIGINSTENFDNELLTIHPYVLSDYENWELKQKCLLLPILSTYIVLQPYTTITSSNKGVSKYIIPSSSSSKYLNVSKKHTTQLTSITYLNDSKEVIETSVLTNSLNKLEIILEIPLTTRYITLDYYFDEEDLITVTPLSFKHETSSRTSLSRKTYDYGNILAINSTLDLPNGCYAQLELELSFKDINGTEISKKKAILPLNNDGLALERYSKVKGVTVYGYWLNSHYIEDDLQNIPDEAYVLYKPTQEDGISAFTESALKLSVKSAKTIDVSSTLVFNSLASNSLTPRLKYLTGLTKNV